MPDLLTALNFADLEGAFLSISVFEGVIGFFFIRLKETSLKLLIGKYLETFLKLDISLKKNLQILSSIE